MSRHSKNNTSSSVFTYAERKMIKDFGTQKQRLGVDSQLKFGMCSLFIHKIKNPLACEGGHLFCKECAFENILAQQKQYEQKVKECEQQKVEKERQKEMKQIENKQKVVQNFEKLEGQYDPTIRQELILDKIQQELQSQTKVTSKQLIEQHKQQLLSQPKSDLAKSNFWLQVDSADQGQSKDQPETKSTFDKPSKKLFCPASQQHHVTMKKLYKLDILEINDEFLCQVCRKQLQYQKIAAPKSCGHVMCYQCAETSCKQSKICATCSKECKLEDLLVLQSSSSSFVSHNQVEATKFTPVPRI